MAQSPVAHSVVLCVLHSAALAQPAARPQMDAAQAARHQAADYLAQGPQPWQPALLADSSGWQADFVVAQDGSGTHRSVQAAIDAVPSRGQGDGRRWAVRIQPGSYRETVCVQHKAALRVFGRQDDPSAVVIVQGRYNAEPKRAGVDAAQPCHPDLAAASVGTPGSASVAVVSDDVQLAHLTIANDAMEGVRNGVGYPPGAGESGGAQAVALLTQGDRLQLHQVRLLGHQDTFHVRRAAAGAAARVLVQDSVIAGDVDFVFGNATLVLERCTLLSRAGRRQPGQGGHVLAPSTVAATALGFLVVNSRLVGEPGLQAGSISLGRAWDEGVARGAWQADLLPGGQTPNGQALVRDSAIGPHIGPWATSTSRRPFSSDGAAANRLAEYRNSGVGAAAAGQDDVLSAGAAAHIRAQAPAQLPAEAPAHIPPQLPAHIPAQMPTQAPTQAPAQRDRAREVLLPNDGWAAADGGTRGGAAALAAHVFDVRSRAQLATALAPLPGRPDAPRIVRLHGRIELSVDDAGRLLGADDYRDPGFDGDAFLRAYDPAVWGRQAPAGPLEDARARSAKRQAERVLLRVPSNTTLIGMGQDAALTGGGLFLGPVSNIIIRNIHFADAYDHFPAWDPKDNAHGDWNSEYDNLTLRGASHVWVDHCTFDDGARPDHAEPVAFGRRVQHHDGLLDITQQSDFVTVSWNHFRNHDKTTLVGSSDSQQLDDGRLKVTFHHNLYEQVKERTPRVRWGRVHVYNNLFVARSGDVPYAHGYSLGVGAQSRIVSQNNVWEAGPGVAPGQLVRLWKGTAFFDRGSLLNGQPVDLLAALRAANPGAEISADVGWQPAWAGAIDPADTVAAKVRAGAGAGRW